MNNITDIEEIFEEWFNELEGFSYRSERFWDDFYYASRSGDTDCIIKWLKSAVQIGYDAAQSK
jgi:hypothetical protein